MCIRDSDIHCSNRDGHGTQTLKRALENSCNVALMQIGESMGAEEFTRYQELFGFGEMTGIDVYKRQERELPALKEGEF